jgi:hypothetical protein
VSVPPWLVLSLVLSLTLALLYQILTRRFGWRIIGYWIAVTVGFIGAEVLAETAGISLLQVGDLRLLPDLIGAAVVIAVLWFLGV